MVINWNRMGYGVSFNENGLKEYEGYWCNDLRFGNGIPFDIEGNMICERDCLNGKEIEYDYEGDGDNLNINVRHMKLLDHCILTCFDVSLFPQLEELIIGNECFENVDTFQIDGVNNLKWIKIGMNSFTRKKNSGGDNPSRSFHVMNCISLESLEIGRYSFSDYSGEFELKNLPSLLKIQIGSIDDDISEFNNYGKSANFCFSSSFIMRDLPNLQFIELGNNAFQKSLSTIISNLPNLKSMKLGFGALWGTKNDDSCSLEMRDLPLLEEIYSNGVSFIYPHSVILENIPNLKIAHIPYSFSFINTKTISNVSPILVEMMSSTQDIINPISNSLHISNGSWNNIHSFNLINNDILESIEIGDECFSSVNRFVIDGLNNLKWIKIGMNSFTKKKNNSGVDPLRSFHVINCISLESIEIGRYSFSDYSGEFELKNLPSLLKIQIGSIENDYSESNNYGKSANFFVSSSFILRDLPNFQFIELGNNSFQKSLSTIISNLPNLKSIKLGLGALGGIEEDDSCSLEMKDLPLLEEIYSNGVSFIYPHSVILENIPNMRIAQLPYSFSSVSSKLISNVSPILVEMMSSTQDIINPISNSLHISNGSWNNIYSFNLSNNDILESIEIGDECFENVESLRINGLSNLKWIKIGMNSFTKKKNSAGVGPLSSFHLINCISLESLEIGRYSFSDYSGEFELKNLPSLLKIQIGSIENDISEFNNYGKSANFCASSSFILRDLPNLQFIELGNNAFQKSLSTIISNLPNLKSIKLGMHALCGIINDVSCSLIMKDLPKLEEICSEGGSFIYPHSVILDNIPILKGAYLPNSFSFVMAIAISNVSSPLAHLLEMQESVSVQDHYYCTSF